MAENDQNTDEYKFAELDSFENESIDSTEYGAGSSPKGQGGSPQGKNIKRNALITVGLIVFIMLMYKFVGGMFSGKSNVVPAKENIPPAPVAELQPPQKSEIAPVEAVPPQPAVQPEVQPATQASSAQENEAALQQKVASIEATQQNVQSEVSSINQQVGSVNNNIGNLSTQISKLNQVISNLMNQVAKQSEEINVLMERTKPVPVKRIIRIRPENQQIIYYINAVIPGRAWLIGTNGSTLTVREGTKIAGYGVVKLIDSLSGRILTSSGRVIKFSQEDS